MAELCPSFNLERLKHVTDSIEAMIGVGLDLDAGGGAAEAVALRRGLAALATRLKPMFFLPDDVLIYEGDRAKTAFFLVRGEVEVKVSPNDKVVRTIGDGEFFGEIALLAQADELWRRVEVHARRLTHSNVQPESVFLTAAPHEHERCVRLGDFGFSRAPSTSAMPHAPPLAPHGARPGP